MCYAGFENGRRICYADHATSENVLHPSHNCHRMCYAVKIRRYRPAVRTADIGKFAMPITKRRKMCYGDHEMVENVLADHAMSEDVLRRSRNVGECATSIATSSENVLRRSRNGIGECATPPRGQRWSVRWSDLTVALGSDRLLRRTGKKIMKNSPHGRFGDSKK